MARIFLFIPFFLGLIGQVFSQTVFSWKKDLDLPYADSNGNALTGTEVIHLVPHKGKLYAGNSYWAENTDPRRGQVWAKNSMNSEWKLDFEMPSSNSRVPSLYSFTFEYDYLGNPIAKDTILFAGSTRDYGFFGGPAVVFMRDDSSNAWIQHNFPQISTHVFGYTQVRSMGFHRDNLTGEDIVFAGASQDPTGIYAGRYNRNFPGKIEWDTSPEFIPSGFQRIMGFAVCNDTLYMATQRQIYKRVDGSNPLVRWELVKSLNDSAFIAFYTQGIDPFWVNEDDIRGFRSIYDSSTNKEVLMFGVLNHMFKLDPLNNYALSHEIDIADLLDIKTGHDFAYIQVQLINDFTNPNTGETTQLIGIEGFYDTLYLQQNPLPNIGGFNQEGYYLERKYNDQGLAEYNLLEIIDFSIARQPDSLARVRTIIPSPFPEDSGKSVYAGGFAPWFLDKKGGVTKTAWIYKGELNIESKSGFNQFKDIPYRVDTPQDRLSLDVYVPIGGAPRKPVMVYVHGGSWRTGDKANVGFKETFFTSRDYVFVSVNYRLSPNPINLNDTSRIKFPDHPQDVASAVRWVLDSIGNYSGDTSRVSLIGHSAGAHLVALVSTDARYLINEGKSINQIKCVCALDGGAYDIPYYLNTYQIPGDGQWNSYVNAFGSDQNTWAEASPINHVANYTDFPSFLLVHQGTVQRKNIAKRFSDTLAYYSVDTSTLNAFPLDHEGINGVLGSENPSVAAYNDSVAGFFSRCLNAISANTFDFEPNKQELKVFPNPSKEQIVFIREGFENGKSNLATLIVYDLNGRILENTNMMKSTTLNISSWPAGVYLVSMEDHETRIHKRFVKID